MRGKSGARRSGAAALLGLALATLVGGAAAAFPMASPVQSTTASLVSPGYTTVAETWRGQAACLTAQDASLAPRLAPLLVPPTGGGVTARIAGFDLRDQSPEAIAAFRALTRRLDKAIAKGKVSAPYSPCQDVTCALSTLVGPELAPRMLLLAMQYGYMTSDLGAEADRRWTARDLDLVLAALADLPQDWFAPADGRYRILLHRHTEAAIRVGAMAPSAGFLVALAGEGYPGVLIADGWDRINSRERRVVMVHELSHELQRKSPSRWRSAWRKAMKADRALSKATATPSSVSIYADTETGEDFAESIATYRYLPALLQTRAPSRYAFLRDTVFRGVEYLSETGCRPEPRMTIAGLATDIADR
jgi:hypothetical protein